jgi:peptide/nickel transport system substrate-binding protein
VEKFGDLKKWEATVGTGPWMLDSYRPNTGMTLSRNPHYFLPGLPYADRVELVVDEDQASRMAAFLGSKYDLGPEFMGVINRPDWSQLKGTSGAAASWAQDGRIRVQRAHRRLHAQRPAALQRRAGAAGGLTGPQPS